MGHYAAEMFPSAKEMADAKNLALAHANRRIMNLEHNLARRPTVDAYATACKALAHWRKEAKRLGRLAGVAPREMKR